MGSSPQYTGYFSPTYDVQLTEEVDDPLVRQRPIDLTGVDPDEGFTLIMQNTKTLEFQYGLGSWEITDAANGKASYQWTSGDLATPARFLIYVTAQLPDEPSPRAFDPDSIRVVLLEKGGAAVSTQDVNLVEINGQTLSSAHPVPISGPVQIADGADVTKGTKADDAVTDPTVSATEIALLKGLVQILALQGVVVTAESDGFADGAITTLGSKSDAAWSGSGSGSGIAILKKIEALLAATQTIAGNVGVTNFPSIQRVDAQSGDFPAGAIADLATLLALAGTSGDANTVASLMGRLTKIRDLLNGTLTVNGAVSVNTISNYAAESGGNLAAIKADADSLVTNTAGLATQATLSSAKADLDTLAGIVSSSKAAVKAGAGDFTDLATLAGTVSGGKGAVKAASGDFADGALATLGAKADAASTDYTTANSGMSFIKGLVKILADAWDNTNHWLQVKVMNSNANGQATMVNSAPVVIASDQTAIASKAASNAFVDGANVTLGTKADTASTDATTTNSQMSFTKGFVKILADVWDNANHLFHSNIKQWNGAVPSATNPVITSSQIQALIANGQGFRVCTADVVTNAANAFVGLQMIANNVGKNIVIYNIYTVTNGNAVDQRLYQQTVTTADTNLTTDLTATPGITNQQPGNATTSVVTSIKGSPANTTQTSGFIGTQSMQAGATANALLNLLQNGSQIYLKSGVVAGFSAYVKVPTSGNLAGMTIEWVEF